MYTIGQFGNMYSNNTRSDAYTTALRRAVTPNSVVLDIGSGTGIFALLACRYGARRIYAVEPNDAINLARELTAANGYSDRLTCIQSVSTTIDLPERADVIVSDLSGQLPFFQRHIPAIIDARDRFLAVGGVLIAQQDFLRTAVVEAGEDYRKLTKPWSEGLFGLDLRPGWRLVANTSSVLTDEKVRLLTQPATLAKLDYKTIAKSNMCVEIALTIDQPGRGHGFAVWFDRIVADGIMISTEPGASERVNVAQVYGTPFFPWLSAVDLVPGDIVALRMKADLAKDQYVWQWETTIYACGNERDIRAHFRQSTLHGYPLSLESLKRQEAEHIPTPSENAQIDAFILSKIDGATSLMQIAHAVAATFPLRFSSWQKALSRVGYLTSQYGEH